jgi:chemotaxis protein MotB
MPARPARMAGHPSAAGGARGRRQRNGSAHAAEGGAAERWLVTYADMLTLLLVLFIVLFSISVVNTSKFISLRSSLSAAFGDGPNAILSGGNGLNQNAADGTGEQLVVPQTAVNGANASATSGAPAGAVPVDYRAQVAREVENYKQIEKSINEALARQGLSGAVQFAIDRRGLVITVVTDALVFPGNSAKLLAEGQRILAVIAPPLNHTPHLIEVDGFTNQENVSTDPYPSGWELSSARASAVVRDLISGGIAESRLSAVGFSDQRPLLPATDPRSVTRNRRVEIVVLSTLPAQAGDELQQAGAQ